MSEAGLLADIAENPDDDTPRLVYADWMQERGEDDRAELVRVQVERARRAEDDPRQAELARREHDLLEAHGAGWADGLAACCETWEFRRGFIERISVKGTAALERESAAIFRRHPIREMRLSGRLAAPEVLGGYAEMARIERLEVMSATGAFGGLARMMESPRWRRLREASFEMVTEADGIAEAIAGAPWARGLRGLELSMSNLGRDGVRALAGSSRLEGLERLDVSFNDDAGDSGARVLVRSERLAGLRSLNLAGTGLTARGMRSLADEEGLSRLRRLEVGFNELGSSGARTLLGSPHLAGLESLELQRIRLGQRGAEALASSALGLLVRLDVSQNNIGPERLRLLLEAPALARLEDFTAGSNALHPEGTRMLADCAWPLRALDLRFCETGDEGVSVLAASERLSGLETLVLHANGIGPEGAAALASGRWPKLRRLGLKNNRVGLEGAAALASSSLRLLALELETNELPTEARDTLRRRFGCAAHLGG